MRAVKTRGWTVAAAVCLALGVLLSAGCAPQENDEVADADRAPQQGLVEAEKTDDCARESEQDVRQAEIAEETAVPQVTSSMTREAVAPQAQVAPKQQQDAAPQPKLGHEHRWQQETAIHYYYPAPETYEMCSICKGEIVGSPAEHFKAQHPTATSGSWTTAMRPASPTPVEPIRTEVEVLREYCTICGVDR